VTQHCRTDPVHAEHGTHDEIKQKKENKKERIKRKKSET
jgi:hypothetical protein